MFKLWFGYGPFLMCRQFFSFFFKNIIEASPQQATGLALALLVHVPPFKGFVLILGCET